MDGGLVKWVFVGRVLVCLLLVGCVVLVLCSCILCCWLIGLSGGLVVWLAGHQAFVSSLVWFLSSGLTGSCVVWFFFGVSLAWLGLVDCLVLMLGSSILHGWLLC